MLKTNLIKSGIIIVLLLSVLTGCGRSEGPVNAEPTTTVESNKEPVYSESPGPKQTIKPDETQNTEQNSNVAQTSKPESTQPSPSESSGSIKMVIDKNIAKKGEIIRAEIFVDNIQGIAGYQVNIKYDPSILQAVDPDSGAPITKRQMPKDGNILVNSKYEFMPLASNDIERGVLNFGKLYINLNDYKNSGNPENSGVIAVIGFKVLEEKSTTVTFEDVATMPDALSGTMLFDWNGKRASGYKIIQHDKIN